MTRLRFQWLSAIFFLLACIVFAWLIVAPLPGQSDSSAIRQAQNANAGKAQEAAAEQHAQGNTILIAVVTTGTGLFFALITLIVTQFFKMAQASQAHKWEVAATAAHRALELQRIDAVQIAVTSSKPRLAAHLRSVLLVDDDADIAPLIRIALGQCAMTLDTAADGVSALAALQGPKKYDLVILDLGLPAGGPSGMDVLLAAKELDTLPVIVLTADLSNEAYVRSLHTGALDVISKPVVPAMLAARLKALFDC